MSSDSDGPPPLVDSSSSDAPPCNNRSPSPSSSSDDDEGIGTSWFEHIIARAGGAQGGASATMPPQFRQLLNDPHTRQRVEQQNLQRQQLALQDRQRDSFKSNFRELAQMKREALDEKDIKSRSAILRDAAKLAQELLADTESLGYEAQRHPVAMLGAELRLLWSEALLDQGNACGCLAEAREAESSLCQLRRERSHPQQKKFLAKAFALSGRAYLALSDETEARRCAAEAVKHGALNLDDELRKVLEVDADSDGAESAGEQIEVDIDAVQQRTPSQVATRAAPKAAARPAPSAPAQEVSDPSPKGAGTRCKKCGWEVLGGKKAIKRHMKDECPRRTVECPDCEDRMWASSLEAHRAKCRMRSEICPHCAEDVTAESLPMHLQQECLQVDLECEFCGWKGLRLHLDEHLDLCPRRKVFCDHCYEEMEQYKMCSHVCAFIAEASECLICSEPWSSTKVPALLLDDKDGRISRSCAHIGFCQDCATVWKEKSAEPGCPLCRKNFSIVAALEDWLWEYVLPRSPEPAPVTPPTPPPAPAPSPAPKSQKSRAKATSKLAPKAGTPAAAKAKTTPPTLPTATVETSKKPGETKKHALGRWRDQQGKDVEAPLGAAAVAPAVTVGAPIAGYPPAQHPAPQPLGPQWPALSSQSAPPQAPSPSSRVMLQTPMAVPPPRHGDAAPPARPSPSSPSKGTAAVQPRQFRFPPPKPENCRKGEMHFVSPLDIHFTHDNINSVFSRFKDDISGQLKEPTLLETVKECLGKKIPDKVDMLDVIRHDGKIYVAGTWNRRLCVHRLLCIFFPERFGRLKVKFRYEREKDRLFTHVSGKTKLSTECNGNWIQIRWGKYVGKQRETDDGWYKDDYKSDPGVIWPEAVKLLDSTWAKQFGRCI